MKDLIIDYRALWKEVRDFFMIAVGSALYCLGVVLFMLPYQLSAGGVSGVSLIIYYATGISIQLSYSVINAIFLLFAIKILGWRFCLKTIHGVAMCTVFMWFWQWLLTDAVTGQLPRLIGDEVFMACLLAAIFEGIGLWICFLNNGSTGGTDIVAACINKFWDVSLGQIIMLCDIVIVSSCYIVFHDWQKVIFGYVFLIVASMTLDFMMRRSHQSVEIKIFSRNYARIATKLTKAGFGVTALEGTGWWTQTERHVLICIARKRHMLELMRLIKVVDPYAFVSVTNVQSVYGEGFDTIKTRIKDQKPILVFCTEDEVRFEEVKALFSSDFEVRSTEEVGCHTNDIRYVKQFFGFDAFEEQNDTFMALRGDYRGAIDPQTFEGPDRVSKLIQWLMVKSTK